MSKKTVTPIKAPDAEAVYAASAMIGKMPEWRQMLKPLMDAGARDFGERGKIAPDVPIALKHFGMYCRTLGKEIAAAQKLRVQAAIAPVPAPETAPAPQADRLVQHRRPGEVAETSAPARGRPRKPARRE